MQQPSSLAGRLTWAMTRTPLARRSCTASWPMPLMAPLKPQHEQKRPHHDAAQS